MKPLVIFFTRFLITSAMIGVCFGFASAQTETLQISAQVNDPNASSGGGGGFQVSTIVRFSGRAYPLSRVTILRDGAIAVTTIAGPDAKFSVALSGLSAGNYSFGVYSQDAENRRSNIFSFPISITSGVTTDISGIFITPTIDVDKAQVKKGDNINIFGQSVPDGDVVISIHSPVELFRTVPTDNTGAYLLTLDTSVLENGSHTTKSKTVLPTEVSEFGKGVSFLVGDENISKDSCGRGDVNCDGRVNLIDFSIMAYWYQKSAPPVKVDLNADSMVNLVDFSIMAFYWTG